MQLGEFIKLLQEAGIPLHYEVIIAGRSEPRLVEPPPHVKISKETVCIDGLQTVFTDKPGHSDNVGSLAVEVDDDPPEDDDWDDDYDDDFDPDGN